MTTNAQAVIQHDTEAEKVRYPARAMRGVMRGVMLGVMLMAGPLLGACKDNEQALMADQSVSKQGKMLAAPAATEAPMEPAKEEAMDLEGEMDDTVARGAIGGMNEDAPGDGFASLRDKGGGGAKGKKKGDRAVAAPRAWFPETFLFEPLVVTDAQGAAEVKVRVPDRLTTWRVLALAHSRQGGQAGALASFLGTLPAYVDLVVPPRLYAGDQVRLPIQVVNTTAAPVSANLVLEAAGARLTGGSGGVTIPARGNLVRYATLTAAQPGQARLLARLDQADTVIRTLDVVPAGRPLIQTRSGTLAAPRTFDMAIPQGAGAATSRARLSVFPGALAILRAELAASAQRGGLAQDAFALLLTGTAPEILRALGDEADKDALRDTTLLTMQRIIRQARTLDMNTATILAEAALSHPDNPVLDRLGKRALQYIEQNQSPDGMCGGATGWPLQRLLVATAECARAAQTVAKVPIRASGAFERHAGQIKDPYTAAAILASGAAAGALARTLRAIVRDAIEERPGGARALKVPAGVVRADGAVPTEIEATALAVLALQGDPGAPLADLGATILAGYSPERGWGDGRANLTGMRAALALFSDPVPDNVAITLLMDGKQVARGALDRDRVREVMVLEAALESAEGTHTWEVRAEPQVPGLGFSFALKSYVPWPRERAVSGLELDITPPRAASVGKPAEVRVQAAAPSGLRLGLDLALPAGVQVDTRSLDDLVSQGQIQDYQVTDESVHVSINALEPAQMFSAAIRVIPTLAGTLHSGAATLAVDGISAQADSQGQAHVPPQAWTVRP